MLALLVGAGPGDSPRFSGNEVANVLQEILQGLVSQTEAPGGDAPGGLLSSPLPVFAIIFVAMYFLIIRPQQKQQKQQQEFIAQLKKGDEVILQGGIFGRIVDVREVDLTVEIASGVKVRALKSAVGRAAPSGSTPGGNDKTEKKS